MSFKVIEPIATLQYLRRHSPNGSGPVVRVTRPWNIAERDATPESIYMTRRRFAGGIGIATAMLAISPRLSAMGEPYSAKRNLAYRIDPPLTTEDDAIHYNNFAEFTDEKEVWKYVDRFRPEPWTLTISGLVPKPLTLDIAKLLRQFSLEERMYRLRCVEGWSMAVPWTGFPFRKLIEFVQPLAEARYVRLVSFYRPDEAPGQKDHPAETWPRLQGLSIAEAMNELTMLVTGIYGHALPKQSGAPIRLVVPWKYGFKSLKSIAGIEFTDRQPQAFWNNIAMPPSHFVANVNPAERYLDRSQSSEKVLGTWQVRPTLIYNGYAQYVERLYGNP